MIKFDRKNFLDIRSSYSIKDLIKLFKDFIIDSNLLNNFNIEDISSLDYIRKNSLIFINDNIDLKKHKLDDVCIVTDSLDLFSYSKNQNILLVKNNQKAYLDFLNLLFIHEDSINYRDDLISINNSLISKYSKIHHSALILNNCVIGKGVEIGKNCIIKNNTVIKNTIIKDDVIISDNSTIGSSGFGFDLKFPGSKNIHPQIGIVYIDNNVHIGSNCTIDRGKIDFTYIGKNSMIDNLVHIAHNVILGENACIAAQSGISGSVKIGKNLISGGQSGFAGHIKIGDNVVVAGKSGVTKNIKDNSVVAGFPAIDIKEWKKIIIREKKNGYK